jgi:hypothetical protein
MIDKDFLCICLSFGITPESPRVTPESLPSHSRLTPALAPAHSRFTSGSLPLWAARFSIPARCMHCTHYDAMRLLGANESQWPRAAPFEQSPVVRWPRSKARGDDSVLSGARRSTVRARSATSTTSTDHHPELMRLNVDMHAMTPARGLPRDTDEAAWLPGGSVARATALGILRGLVAPPAWQGVAELAATIEGALCDSSSATTAARSPSTSSEPHPCAGRAGW